MSKKWDWTHFDSGQMLDPDVGRLPTTIARIFENLDQDGRRLFCHVPQDRGEKYLHYVQAIRPTDATREDILDAIRGWRLRALLLRELPAVPALPKERRIILLGGVIHLHGHEHVAEIEVLKETFAVIRRDRVAYRNRVRVTMCPLTIVQDGQRVSRVWDDSYLVLAVGMNPTLL